MRRGGSVVAGAAVWLLSACGEGVPQGTRPTRSVQAFESTWTVPEPLERIVATTASAVEYLDALGFLDRVVLIPEPALEYASVALDDETWPASRRFATLEAETLLTANPDLVVAHGWQSVQALARVSEAGVTVVTLPVVKSWDDVLTTARELGRVLGVSDRAESLIQTWEKRRESLQPPTHLRGLRVLPYTNFGSGGWTAGRETTASIALELAGFVNVAADADMNGHVRIDLERVLTLEPDAFLVGAAADDGEESNAARRLRQEESLRPLDAMTQGRVLALPRRLNSSNSFTLLDAAEALMIEAAACIPPPESEQD